MANQSDDTYNNLLQKLNTDSNFSEYLKDVLIAQQTNPDWTRKNLEELVSTHHASWSLEDNKFLAVLAEFHARFVVKFEQKETKEEAEQIRNTISQDKVVELVAAHAEAQKPRDTRLAETIIASMERRGAVFSAVERATLRDQLEETSKNNLSAKSREDYAQRTRDAVKKSVASLKQTTAQDASTRISIADEATIELTPTLANRWVDPSKAEEETVREKQIQEDAAKTLLAPEPDQKPVNHPVLYVNRYLETAYDNPKLETEQIAHDASVSARREELMLAEITGEPSFGRETHFFEALADRGSARQKSIAVEIDRKINELSQLERETVLTTFIGETLQGVYKNTDKLTALVGSKAASIIAQNIDNSGITSGTGFGQVTGAVGDIIGQVSGGGFRNLAEEEILEVLETESKHLVFHKDGTHSISGPAHLFSGLTESPHAQTAANKTQSVTINITSITQYVRRPGESPFVFVADMGGDAVRWASGKAGTRIGEKIAVRTGLAGVWQTVKSTAGKAGIWIATKLGLKGLIAIGASVIGTPVLGIITTVATFGYDIIKGVVSRVSGFLQSMSKTRMVGSAIQQQFGLPAVKQKIPLYVWVLLILLSPMVFTVGLPDLFGVTPVWMAVEYRATALMTDITKSDEGLDKSSFIGVDLTADPSSIACSETLPKTVTFTVTITAEKDGLENISVDTNANLISATGIQSLPVTAGSCPSSLGAGETAVCTYTITVDETNAKIVFTASVTADVTGQDLLSEVTAKSTDVKVCNPPSDAGFRCSGTGAEIWYPGAIRNILPVKTKFCIHPSIIVIHWSGGHTNNNGNQSTFDTLVQRGLACQFATDTTNTWQMQNLWEGDEKGKQSELAWCVGGSYNNLALNNEIAGNLFDDSWNPDTQVGDPRKDPSGAGQHMLDMAYENFCWMMKTFNIPASQVYGHFQLSPYKPDPGSGFLAYMKGRLASDCH